MYHNILKGKMENKQEGCDAMQKMIRKIFIYLYSDDDIERKDEVANEILEIINHNKILKFLKRNAESLLKSESWQLKQSSEEKRKEMLEISEFNEYHPFMIDCYS